METWRRAAEVSLEAGAGTVWAVGDTANGGHAGRAWCDPCTLAGSVARELGGASIGVVSPVPGGRHPSVLARDVTTLDVLSAGRAALQVRWTAPAPTDLTVACEHLADAVAVCAAMLRGGDPDHDGHHFRVSGALNRPAPRQEGGPPIVVASPGVLDTELAAGGRTGRVGLLARRTTVLADAVTCGTDPSVVAAWRALLEAAGPQDDGPGRRTGLVCALRPGWGHGTARDAPSELGRASSRARDAGATGVLVVAAPPGADADIEPGWLAHLAAEAFAPWGVTRC